MIIIDALIKRRLRAIMKSEIIKLLIGAIPNFNEFIDRLGAKTLVAICVIGGLIYLGVEGIVPGEWVASCMVITGVGFFAFRRAQEKEQACVGECEAEDVEDENETD